MDKQLPANTGRAVGRGNNPQRQNSAGRGYRADQAAHASGLPSTSTWGQRPAGGNEQGQRAAQRAPVHKSVDALPSQLTSVSCSTGAPPQRPLAPFVERQKTAQSSTSADAFHGVSKEENRGSVRGKRVISELVVTRPKNCVQKAGKAGNLVQIQTNYFRFLQTPEWSIHQYRVDFAPDVDLIGIRRALVTQHKEIFGGYIFDGTMLFSATYLGNRMEHGAMELMSKNREDEIILMRIRHVGVVDSTDAQQMQVLNLILRRAMAGLNLQLVGRNFFDCKAKVSLDAFRLEIWPGYLNSVRQHERDILLCTDITHKVMRTESVYSILTTCLSHSDDFQTSFKQQVIGMVVLTDYNNKTYRVDDVDFNLSPKSTFATKEGEVTYIKYYSERYKIVIRDHNQPLLVSRPSEKSMRGGVTEFVMLIPEIARATGMTDAMRSDFRLMKAMGEHTRLAPDHRIQRLRTFNNRLQQSPESMNVLNTWNMKLDKNLVEVPGRILPPEKILFGGQHRYVCDRQASWDREFRKAMMYSHVDIKRWSIVLPRRNIREVQNFVSLCVRAARGMHMHIAEPRYEEMTDDRIGSYSKGIDKTANEDPQILMVVLASRQEEKYSCIKKKCCVDRPIPSQVVTLSTIAPRNERASAGLMSVATKVVIQMNAKLMGAPWMIDLPLTGLMTVGFDVCHSAKEKNKSYGALVATMDLRSSTRYYSAVTEHLKGQELSNEVSLNMTCALQAYKAEHGSLPQRILFFRDGVGDGQLNQVVDTEVKVLKQKLDEIYRSAGVEGGCRLAFIVVSKRINTRYFLNKQNPPPGTVVDDIITLPERFDFFLVSQSVRQGTVSPTSYNVIFDTFGMNVDRIQMLTYKMTHMYFNWSGTCRVPAVCQYAHKLAFLVAESIHRSPSNGLENQLYFL